MTPEGTGPDAIARARPVAVITGASAGIGVELARVFARNGHGLALVARREERLQRLADELFAAGARMRPIVIADDLEAPGAAGRIGAALAAQGAEPQFIVNNAGFGLLGQAVGRDRATQLGMIDLNVRALTDLSLAFADSLARHRGGILNVGSMAGFLPGPGMAVYYATKAFVLSFSEALHAELAPRGIRVCVLCPGPVPTEFGARAGVRPGVSPELITLMPDRVAEAGYRGLMAGRAVVIPGVLNRLAIALVGLVPRRLLLAAVGARQLRRGAKTG